MRIWHVITPVYLLAFVSLPRDLQAQTGYLANMYHDVLDNGLQVVIVPDHRAPVVTHMLWYAVGSGDDPVGRTGTAHYLEHLMFSGTSTHANGVFDAAVKAVGGMQNAFTSVDHTVYFQRVPPEALATVMAFEADRMHNLTISENAADIERKVVAEERRVTVENTPSSVMIEELDATLYQRHPYRNPVIGWGVDLPELDSATARAFYNTYYAPANAVLVIVGHVQPPDILDEIQATYGALPGASPVTRARPKEPVPNSRRTVTLRDDRVGRAQFRTSWVVPSYATAESVDAEALALLAHILGGGPQSRMYQKDVVINGNARSVSARYYGHSLDHGQFALTGAPLDPNGIAALEASFAEELTRIARDGVSNEALNRDRKRMMREAMFERDDQLVLANWIGSVLTTGGDVGWLMQENARLMQVTPQDIQRVARDWLRPHRSATGYLLPASEPTR